MPRPSETISSVGEVLKAAGELLKTGQQTALKSALLAAGAAWLGPAFALAAGAAMLVKPVAKLIEDHAKTSPPEIGKKALTGAFIAAAVMALDRVGRPWGETAWRSIVVPAQVHSITSLIASG